MKRTLFLLCLGLLAGCGSGGPRPETVEIRGNATLNGKPVTRVTLSFIPVEPGKGVEDMCTVENGTYQTKIFAGKYKVTFEPARGGTNIPAKYRKPSSTPLTLEVNQSIEKDWELN